MQIMDVDDVLHAVADVVEAGAVRWRAEHVVLLEVHAVVLSAARRATEDASVDLVTANGIFNLSPDKDAVMREVTRVLRPGGRTIFAEIIAKQDLPGDVPRDEPVPARVTAKLRVENRAGDRSVAGLRLQRVRAIQEEKNEKEDGSGKTHAVG